MSIEKRDEKRATILVGLDRFLEIVPKAEVQSSPSSCAIDDTQDGKKITKPYLEDAVAATSAGTLPAVTETPATGCAVRYVKDVNERK